MAYWLHNFDTNQVIFAAVDKLKTRHRPKRVQGRTRYIFEQDGLKELSIHIRHQSMLSDEKDHFLSRPSLLRDSVQSADTSQTEVETEAKQQVDTVRQLLRDSILDDFIAEVDESAKSSSLLTTDEKYAKQAISSSLFLSVDVQAQLGPCRNILGGRILLSHPGLELGGLPARFSSDYVSIARLSARGSSLVKPLWPLANHAEELFSEIDDFAHQRFDAVLAVAVALCVAAGAGWPHRRLNSACIFVHRDWAPSTRRAGTETSSTVLSESSSATQTFFQGVEGCVKVVHFRCPLTDGCTNGCEECARYLHSALQSYGQDYLSQRFAEHARTAVAGQHPSAKPNRPVNFAAAFGPPAAAFDDGRGADIAAFAAFVLWLYAGTTPDHTYDPTEDPADPHISSVPWPLRYIVVDGLSKSPTRKPLPFSTTVQYLYALRESRIRPHALGMPLVYTMSPLRGAAMRATLAAARSDEPQAMVHLGMLLEESGLCINNSDTENSQESVANAARKATTGYMAYGLFASAVFFGEPHGYWGMARIQAAWIDEKLPRPPDAIETDIQVDIVALCRCILQAAFGEVEDAVRILENIGDPGFDSASELLGLATSYDPGAEREVPDVEDGSEQGIVSETELESKGQSGEAVLQLSDTSEERILNAVVNVAKCWRRGTAGLPVDIAEARKWLELTQEDAGVFKKVSCPAGTLELGLLERQDAQSAEDMARAFLLVEQASKGSNPIVTSTAYFWLGWWYYNGLKWNGMEIVSEDEGLAGMLFKESAECEHPNKDSMYFYSRFLKEGFGNVEKDEVKARVWNNRAREAGSISAQYRYAFELEEEARKLYKQKVHGRVFLSRPAVQSGRGTESRSQRSLETDSESVSMPQSSRLESSVTVVERVEITTEVSDEDKVRSNIEMKLRRARRVLISAIEKMKMDDPEQAYNPIAYFMLGRLIVSNMRIWMECSKGLMRSGWEIDTKKKVDFQTERRKEALSYLRQAKNMNSNEEWKRYRVNYIEDDQKWIEAAADRYVKEGGP